MKSDSLLKPSILVLCDMAKELLTRNGGPKEVLSGDLRVSYSTDKNNIRQKKNIDVQCHSEIII